MGRAWKVLAALGCLHSAALGAQGTGVIRGVVADSLTGRPLVGAKAAVIASGRYGREPTDSTGRYRLDRVPSGTWVVEFHCPSRTLLGCNLVQRRVTVVAGEVVALDVRVPTGACFEPDSSAHAGIFRGHYSSGFEKSRFVPCPDSVRGRTDAMLPGEHVVTPSIWVTFSPSAMRQQVPWSEQRSHELDPDYFVRWRGTLTGPGTYGHMGVSAFAFVVDSVLEVRPARRADCR